MPAIGLLLVLVGLPPMVASADAGSAPRPPNLVLIMAEDLSPRIGAYGDPLAHTPNIDQLAGEGVRFTRVFTSAGVCAASRAGIIMGVHQNSWGAGHMRAIKGGYVAVPPPDWKAFPELLRRAGYYVVNSDKTDYQMSSRLGGAFGGPFSIWDEEWTEDWRGREPNQPFFAYLTIANTHESQVWPTWRMSSLTQLLMAPMRIANHMEWLSETDPASLQLPPYYPDTPTVRADLARHYNNIGAMDAIVGEILAKLAEDGVLDETIVLFTTDHGDGLPRAKRWVYDSGIHVPLIVRWPEQRGAGQLNQELVSGVDFAPTLLSLAGAAVPEHMQGRVFLGPDKQPEPELIYAARDRIDEQLDGVRAARDRRFKYIRNLHPELPYVLPGAFRNQMPMMQELLALDADGLLAGVPALWFRRERPAEELYDTLEDPHEIRDLAGDPGHAARLEKMRGDLDDWLERSGDLGLLPETTLAERFWPGGEQPETAPPAITREESRIRIDCPTKGASIGVRKDGGPWLLYTGPFDAPSDSRIEAKAVRYGYAESGVETAP